MKLVTVNLIKFGITAIILTISFRYFLTFGIEQKSIFSIILSATSYAILMFLAGWYFGKKDWMYLPIYDVGFRFHLTTYLLHNIISESWFLFGLHSRYEKVAVIHSTALIWSLFLIAHFLYFLYSRRDSINNLDKDALFD